MFHLGQSLTICSKPSAQSYAGFNQETSNLHLSHDQCHMTPPRYRPHVGKDISSVREDDSH